MPHCPQKAALAGRVGGGGVGRGGGVVGLGGGDGDGLGGLAEYELEPDHPASFFICTFGVSGSNTYQWPVAIQAGHMKGTAMIGRKSDMPMVSKTLSPLTCDVMTSSCDS